MGDFGLIRGAIAVAVAACSSSTLIPPCAPNSRLQVRTALYPTGVVTTAGNCTPVSCSVSADGGGGCVVWVGAMTGNDAGQSCAITLTLPDGTRFSRAVTGIDYCGAPEGQNVSFDD